jgi:hypothetical protein
VYQKNAEDIKMVTNGAQATIQALFAQAGVTINGDNAWDIQVHNNDLYSRLLSGSALALGESYMDRWWDCASLDQFIFKVLRANLDQKVKGNYRPAGHLDNAFVIGDAAGLATLDLGEGTGPAIESGILAAKTRNFEL